MSDMPSDTECGDANAIGSSAGGRDTPLTDGSSELEPYVGMEFQSDEAARRFYDEYAISLGFIMRIDHLTRSVHGDIISRRLKCNKAGSSKSAATSRTGCEAQLDFKRTKIGKWVVTKFIKNHNHPLTTISPAVQRRSLHLSHAPDEKDAKIQELTAELQRERKRSAAYLQQLEMVLQDMEEQSGSLSRNIKDIVQSMRGIESSRGSQT